MARLVIFDDGMRGLELPNRPVLIGRSKKNDIPMNDRLLSRKHCSIVPVGNGYRLLDLKSSNGTYLNGQRIEKVDLAVDDIIEIGQTVMVFLEEGVWSRGEGLARLRNPVKAQELIARIRRHVRSKGKEGKIPQVAVASAAPGGGPAAERAARRLRGVPRRKAGALQLETFSDMPQLLEDFITERAVRLLTRESARMRRLMAEVLAEALASPSTDSPPSAPELRARIRAALRARLSSSAGAPSAWGGPGGVSPASGEVESERAR